MEGGYSKLCIEGTRNNNKHCAVYNEGQANINSMNFLISIGLI